MSTAAVKITEAELKRQAAGSVRDVRDLENKGLYLRFNKAHTGGSWYLVLKGEWNQISTFPELTHGQLVAALPSIRLRLAAGEGASLSKWDTVGELLDWFADRMSRDRNLSTKRKNTGASMIECHLKPRLGDLALISLDKAALDLDVAAAGNDIHRLRAFRVPVAGPGIPPGDQVGLDLGQPNGGDQVQRLLQGEGRHQTVPAAWRSIGRAAGSAGRGHGQCTAGFDARADDALPRHANRRNPHGRWSHISLAEREWFIPAENTKTGVEHHLPLTEQVCTLLVRYREGQQGRGYDGQFLFPARNGKALGEAQGCAVFRSLGQGEWTSHDLRKVARTGWADLGVDHLIGELLINHAMGHNVKVYIRPDVMSRKRDALEQWHAHLDQKGFAAIHGLTGVRFEDSGNPLQATEHGACKAIEETTIGEV